MSGRRFGAAAGLIALCVFALCVFFVLAGGVELYRSISADMEEQYGPRTAAAYLTARVHRGDEAGSVSLYEMNGGVPAIAITRSIEGDNYVTCVYLWDGYLTELFCPQSEIGLLLPSDGLRILPAETLELSMEGDLLRMAVTTEYGGETALVCLRSGGAA